VEYVTIALKDLTIIALGLAVALGKEIIGKITILESLDISTFSFFPYLFMLLIS